MVVEGEEPEYESDPEDALLPSVMRRQEASDDEDGERSDGGEKPVVREGIGSDGESDQGAALEYEGEEEFDGEEEDEGEVGEEFEEKVELAVDVVSPEMVLPELDGREFEGEAEGFDGVKGRVEEEVEEDEKKENAPYAVPTTGAFYMHDDRFQQNDRGRQRRMPGGRKLWDSKDDHAWVHDRFEELNMQDAHRGEEKRVLRGRFRGRGKSRGRGTYRGSVRGSQSRVYDDTEDQIHTPKILRGRGPRRYQPLANNRKNTYANQNKPYVKHLEQARLSRRDLQSSHASDAKPGSIVPLKNAFSSSLNFASPPFYPSRESSLDISTPHGINGQAGNTSRTISSSMQVEDNCSTIQSGLQTRGKAVSAPDRKYMKDSDRLITGKTLANSQLHPSVSSLSPISTVQSLRKVQTKNVAVSAPSNHSNPALGKAAWVQPPLGLRRILSTTEQLALWSTTQKMGQQSGNGTHAAHPTEGPARNSSEVGEDESSPGASKSSAPSDAKGKMGNQAPGKGPFSYNDAQVLGASGAIGLPHGGQGFPATAALLQVMQLPGQHAGGIGVPAVGMALPGYVAHAQLGLDNSEMTWLPVLAGAAGALGESYGSPYITLGNSYYSHSSGQTSSITSRETNTTEPAEGLKPPQRHDIVSDGFGQRQNKPRRYSEMNFGL